jgi:hypothetical protein
VTHFIQIAEERIINLALIFDAGWFTADDGERVLELQIAGTIFRDEENIEGPHALYLTGEQAAHAWAALLARAGTEVGA